MVLYPKVSEPLQLAAILASYGAAVPLGLWCYSLLRPLRARGRLGRAVAQFWAWWVAVAAGTMAAVWVAGPYVFAGRTRSGGWITDPITPREVLVYATVLASGYTFFGLFRAFEPPEPPQRGGT